MSPDPKTPRIEILAPLRGLAATLVCWIHFTNDTDFVKTEWLRASGRYGWLGVQVFFVVSGFVIPYSMYCGRYRPREHFGRFLAKRLIRLEPPYLASIGLILGLWYLSSLVPGFHGKPPDFSMAQLLLHLGYLNTFFGLPWFQNVYWTLGIEFQYYLFVALIYPLLTAPRPLVRAGVLVGMAVAPLLIQTPMLVFHYLGLFTLGSLAFLYHVELMSGKLLVPAVFAVVAIIIVNGDLPAGLTGGATSALIAFVSMPRNSAMRLLAFLGGISYSLYLVHVPVGGRVVNLGMRYSGGIAWEWAVLAMAIGMSIAAAFFFNWFIEQPFQRLASQIKYRPYTESRPKLLQASSCNPSLVAEVRV